MDSTNVRVAALVNRLRGRPTRAASSAVAGGR